MKQGSGADWPGPSFRGVVIMGTASTAGRTNAGVAAAIGTALAGAVLALITGLGQGIATGSADTVSTSSVSSTIDIPGPADAG